MKHTPSRTPHSSPRQAVQSFCARYTLEEAQQELWKWCILALKDGYDRLGSERTARMITFYEHLKAHLAATYELQELPQAHLPTEDAAPEDNTPAGPFRFRFSTRWMLLICPPD